MKKIKTMLVAFLGLRLVACASTEPSNTKVSKVDPMNRYNEEVFTKVAVEDDNGRIDYVVDKDIAIKTRELWEYYYVEIDNKVIDTSTNENTIDYIAYYENRMDYYIENQYFKGIYEDVLFTIVQDSVWKSQGMTNNLVISRYTYNEEEELYTVYSDEIWKEIEKELKDFANAFDNLNIKKGNLFYEEN